MRLSGRVRGIMEAVLWTPPPAETALRAGYRESGSQQRLGGGVAARFAGVAVCPPIVLRLVGVPGRRVFPTWPTTRDQSRFWKASKRYANAPACTSAPRASAGCTT